MISVELLDGSYIDIKISDIVLVSKFSFEIFNFLFHPYTEITLKDGTRVVVKESYKNMNDIIKFKESKKNV